MDQTRRGLTLRAEHHDREPFRRPARLLAAVEAEHHSGRATTFMGFVWAGVSSVANALFWHQVVADAVYRVGQPKFWLADHKPAMLHAGHGAVRVSCLEKAGKQEKPPLAGRERLPKSRESPHFAVRAGVDLDKFYFARLFVGPLAA
jgi:hypothetical protein